MPKRTSKTGKKRLKSKAKTLPDHIITEQILPRLPVTTLLSFKSVSKHWYSTISSAQFAKSNLLLSSPSSQFIILTPYQGELQLLLCQNLDNGKKDLVPMPVELQYHSYKNIKLVGSANGLVCLYLSNTNNRKSKPNKFMVVNPFTCQTRDIVCPKDAASAAAYGFGYLHAADEYKIAVFGECCDCEDNGDYGYYDDDGNNWGTDRWGKWGYLGPHYYNDYDEYDFNDDDDDDGNVDSDSDDDSDNGNGNDDENGESETDGDESDDYDGYEYDEDKKVCFYVCSLKDGEWKRIACPKEVDFGIEEAAAVVGESFYWSGNKGRRAKAISAISEFNLVTEKLEAKPRMKWLDEYTRSDLFQMNGCLGLRCFKKENRPSDFWVLKKADGWNSWEKLFSVHLAGRIYFTETGKCLVKCRKQYKLVAFTRKALQGCLKKGVDDTINFEILQARDVVESLVSPLLTESCEPWKRQRPHELDDYFTGPLKKRRA